MTDESTIAAETEKQVNSDSVASMSERTAKNSVLVVVDNELVTVPEAEQWFNSTSLVLTEVENVVSHCDGDRRS